MIIALYQQAKCKTWRRKELWFMEIRCWVTQNVQIPPPPIPTPQLEICYDIHFIVINNTACCHNDSLGYRQTSWTHLGFSAVDCIERSDRLSKIYKSICNLKHSFHVKEELLYIDEALTCCIFS